MSTERPHKAPALASVPLVANNAHSLALQFLDYATRYRWKFHSPFVVFPKYGIAFLAIPRSGTTSLRYALTPLLGLGLDFEAPKYRHTFGHYMRSCSRRAAATKYSGFFRFTFVRNPWTRLYSCYLAKIRTKSNRNLRHLGLDQCRSFEDFALRVCDIPDERADPHFASQSHLLSYRGKFLADEVYHFESYIEDWRRVRHRIEAQAGIPLKEIPHYYRMSSEDYLHVYSDDLADRVGRRYRGDCERFGYTYPDGG